MNNIRQIITERLENASLDYRYWLSGVGFDGIIEPDFYKIEGQIDAYQDCLNLIDEYTPKIVTKQLSVKEIETLLQDLNKPHQFIIDKPAPRTEADILKDFEKMGYEIIVEKDHIRMSGYEDVCLYIDFIDKTYSKNKYLQSEDITMQEHKLLNELFEVWGWL